jgi:cell division septation protein DedD
MRNNETGEFELVVGNRQLLSGFFIVVLLFAVAFAMGYVVGQNSPRSAKLAEAGSTGAATSAADRRPQPASPAPPASPPSTPPALPADGASASTPPADTSPQPSTQPARDAQPATAAPTAPATPATTPDMTTGAYWQVLATASQSSAQAMLQTLKNRGFPASLQPGPNNLTRVVVGPYTDTQSLGRAKTELESAGFQPVRK